MKKLLSLVLVAVFCFATLGVFVFADGPAAATITASKVEGAVGEVVTVEFAVAENPGINGLKIRVGYDSDAVAIVENDKGKPDATNGIWVGNFQPGQKATNNPFVMVWANSDNNTEDGVFGRIKFKILDTAVVGVENAITIEVVQCVGNNEATSEDEDVSLTAVNGYIKIPPVKVTGVTLNKTALTLAEGANETLEATVAPSNATDKTVTWKSSDESVATVDEAGCVTAVSIGTATIKAEAGNFYATATVTVTCSHDWDGEPHLVSAANCKEAAVYSKVCSKCGDISSETYTVGDPDPDAHVTGTVGAVAATCEEAGYTGDVVCTLCGEVIEEGTVIEALGHKIVKVEAVAATTTANGVKEHYKCENCGTLYADEEGKTVIKAEDVVIPMIALVVDEENEKIEVKADGKSSVEFKFNSSAKLKEVKVNGVVIDAKNYNVAADGTVTLTAAYIETLAAGEYDITFVCEEGEIATQITVTAAPSAPQTADYAVAAAALAALSIGAVVLLKKKEK